MSASNFAMFVGNLTKNPEGRDVTVGGEARRVLNFSIAVNTRRSKGNEVPPTYVDLEVWDKAAKVIEDNLVKGDKILVQGEYKTDIKEGDDGQRRYFHKFRVNDFELLKVKKWSDPAPEPEPEDDGDDEEISF